MIPVIIGAAAVGLGAVLLSGDDKSKQPAHTEKRQVSEDYVMAQLNRAGKNFQTGSKLSVEEIIFYKLRNLIVEQLGVEPDEVKMNSHFVYDLGADSLDIVELIMAVEEEFNVEILDEVAIQIETIDEAVFVLKELTT